MPAGVVFDMDGTLLDTEKLARSCYVQACADFDWPFEAAVFDRCVGTTWEETERILRSSFGPAFPYDDIEARWTQLYHNHVDHYPVDVKPGIEQVLAKLAQSGVPLSVATSSLRPTVERKLELARLDHHFEFLICGGETVRGKPFADPYLAAVERMQLAPRTCWAIEDSDNGVRSAIAAGLVVFQIPDEMAPADEIVSFGHEILPSAVDLLAKLL